MLDGSHTIINKNNYYQGGGPCKTRTWVLGSNPSPGDTASSWTSNTTSLDPAPHWTVTRRNENTAFQAPASPGTRWDRQGHDKDSTHGRVQTISFNTKSIYLHTQRWENHRCFRVDKQCREQWQICSCTKRKTHLLRGGGYRPFCFCPKTAPQSRGRGTGGGSLHGGAARSLSVPKKAEPPVLFVLPPWGARGGRFRLQCPPLHRPPSERSLICLRI